MSGNDKRQQYPYNVVEPPKGLVERLNECADFVVVASEPVSETQIICITYKLIADMGQHPEDCQAWMNQDKNPVNPSRPTSLRRNKTSESGNRPRARAATEPTTWSE